MHQLLRGVPIFAGLDDAALDLFLKHSKKVVAPPGTVLAREGEASCNMFLIGSGSVRIIKNFGQTDEIELATLGGKDFFGEMCILEPQPRCATALAATKTTLFNVPAAAFYHLYKDKPDQYGILLLNIARDLSRRLRRLDAVFAAKH